MAKRKPKPRSEKKHRVPVTKGAVALQAWLRKHPEATQQTIADRTGVRQSTVSKWLGSSRPETPVAVLLEKLTGISPMDWWRSVNDIPTRKAS